MKLLIACPFTRLHELDTVVNTWKDAGAPLLLCVTNELALRIPKSPHYDVIVGQTSTGHARNMCIEYARKINVDWIVMVDDDDYYNGKKYLQHIQNNISDDVDAISSGIGFVRFDDGNLHLFNTPLHFVPGNACACRISKASEFAHQNLGEDVIWTNRMIESGSKIKHIEPWHFIYNRKAGIHSNGAGQFEFMKCFGPSKLIGKVPNSFVNDTSNTSKYEIIEVSDEELLREMQIEINNYIPQVSL